MRKAKSGDGYTYRCEYVRCGKAACNACPHGPYWYRYIKVSGRTKKEYVGKTNPDIKPTGRPDTKRDPRDNIFSSKTASAALAREILKLKSYDDYTKAKTNYRFLQMQHHPDRGGDEHESKLVSAAWSYLRSVMGWN